MVMALTVRTRGNEEAASIRQDGNIPAVLYGPEIKPISVMVPYRAFDVLERASSESTLIDLSLDDKAPVKVLIQDVQYDPVSGRIVHADFRQINMNKELTTTLTFHFVGESAAVKELGGTLIKALENITIKCLPKDLVSHVDVDISKLKNFQDIIRISDVALPAGITVVGGEDTVVAKVTAPLTEDEIKAMEAGDAVPKVEEIELSEKKGKKEEEEAAAEGEAPKAEEPKAKKE